MLRNKTLHKKQFFREYIFYIYRVLREKDNIMGFEDAISAIKAQISLMSEFGKQQFTKETGVDISEINFMNYDIAEQYCKKHNINLNSTNVWADYNKAQKEWYTYHDLYTQAYSEYKTLNYKKNTAHEKYDELCEIAIEKNGGQEIDSTRDREIRRESNYTTETIKNAKQAEMDANSLLDKCIIAVNNQYAGLRKGTLGEAAMNFNA